MSAGGVERVGAGAFEGARLRRPDRVAVAFVADWCPFCRSFAPEFETLGVGKTRDLLFADLTSEESPLWDTFRIEIVPTVIVFEDGVPIHRADGRAGYGLDADDLARIRSVLRSPGRGEPGAAGRSQGSRPPSSRRARAPSGDPPGESG